MRALATIRYPLRRVSPQVDDGCLVTIDSMIDDDQLRAREALAQLTQVLFQ